jgi:hypothetical protein
VSGRRGGGEIGWEISRECGGEAAEEHAAAEFGAFGLGEGVERFGHEVGADAEDEVIDETLEGGNIELVGCGEGGGDGGDDAVEARGRRGRHG